MEQREIHISDAELEIMKALWARGSAMTAKELSGALSHKGWKYSTIATLCGRMVDKGAVTYERKGRFFHYTPTVTEDEYRAMQTQGLISRLYNGSVKSLVAALFENRALSESDVRELKQKFDL